MSAAATTNPTGSSDATPLFPSSSSPLPSTAVGSEEVFDEADFGAFLSRYEGFGSFFSADVEVLIRQKEGTEYEIPTFPAFAALDKCLAATTPEGFMVPAAAAAAAAAPCAFEECDNANTSNNTINDTTTNGTITNTGDVVGSSSDAIVARNAAMIAANKAMIAALPTPPPFGRAFRDAFFAIRDDFTFINHGAFGGSLKLGTYLKHQFEGLMESQLLTYMDRLVLPWVTHSTRTVADTVLHCKPTDLVLVPNATYGLNAAIAGLITHGDVVVFLESEYLAVFKMLQERCETLLAASVKSGGALAPAALKELPIDGLLLDEAIMGSDEALAQHIAAYLPSDTTVLVMDLITSTASLHFPVFTHIIPAVRKALPHLRHIIVDGAHGPLQCEVNIGALSKEQLPSVYVGNLHKWFSAPKSVGVMWVREDVQEEIRPIIVSHGAKNGFLSDFVWDGTRDHGAVLALPTIIDFWYKYIGIDKVRAYCADLKQKAIAMLSAAWNTSIKDVPRGAPFMSLVMLPPFFQQHSRFITSKYLQDTLHRSYNIEVPVKIIRGQLFLRISFFVNNALSDYEIVRDAVLAIQQSIVSDLRAAKAVRLAHCAARDECSSDNPSGGSCARVGSKRSRSPAAAASSVGASAAPLSAVDLQRKLQQQHHDKSQIVRPASALALDEQHRAVSAASSSAASASPSATSVANPIIAPNPLSAASGLKLFSPYALDVPLSIGGFSRMVITSSSNSHATNNLNGDLNNNTNTNNNGSPLIDSSSSAGGGAAAATSPTVPTSSSSNNVDAAGGGGILSSVASSTHDLTLLASSLSIGGGIGGVSPSKQRSVMTLAEQAQPAAVDPNCNGCGLGAIGAAPKKTRKF